MALLPNHNKAFIDILKLKGYCLNSDHPVGKFKAKVFHSVLGFSDKDAEKLKSAILIELFEREATLSFTDKYGSRYVVDIKISNLQKEAIVRTVWIIPMVDGYPKLITCFVKSQII